MKRLAIAVALALGHLGVACTRLGERIVRRAAGAPIERKPPARVDEPARPAWRMPDVGELDYVRACVRSDPNPKANHVYICRGPGKGCTRRTTDECPDCYRVPWHDPRSSAEILQSMERGDG